MHFRHIGEISTPRKALTPVDGYLDFPVNSSMKSFRVETIDNLIPEPDAVYIVRLIDVKGGGKLGTRDQASSSLTSTWEIIMY